MCRYSDLDDETARDIIEDRGSENLSAQWTVDHDARSRFRIRGQPGDALGTEHGSASHASDSAGDADASPGDRLLLQ